VGAGRDLIAGLLRGIVAGLEAVWDKVSSIAGKIKSLKGPESYDKRLLIPEGNWIMDSLELGLSQGQARVEAKVSSVASSISAAMRAGLTGASLLGDGTGMGSVMGGKSGPTIHIEHYQEADGGNARRTSEELYMLITARGGGVG